MNKIYPAKMAWRAKLILGKQYKRKLEDLPRGENLENPEDKIIGFVKEYIKTDEPTRNKKWDAPMPFPKEVERTLKCPCGHKWKENYLEPTPATIRTCGECGSKNWFKLK